MIYWGVVSLGHDASITVVRDGEILFAAHAERYSKVKNDPNINQLLVDEAMTYGKPDKVVWYERPFLKATRHLYAGQKLPELNIRAHLRSFGIEAPLSFASHHESHAGGGFHTSGLEDASILVCDAVGEWDCISIWSATKDKIVRVRSETYPNSLGLLYSAFTQRIGLKPNEDEYILMGMAALGKPIYVKEIRERFIEQKPAPSFSLKENPHRGILDWKIGLPESEYPNVAASIQAITEEWLVDTTKWMKANLPSGNLVISGGVALNCRANSEIAKTKLWDNIWIMPNPGDAGSSMGAISSKVGTLRWQTPYLGHDIKGWLDIPRVIDDLMAGQVVGIAMGRAEWGPRSLGNRAIITDPRGPTAKDRTNQLKARQAFRPFAPMVIREKAHLYFDMVVPHTPYMQFTHACKYPDLYPAICHVDGTSRVQTVDKEDNPQLYKLLVEWEKASGCALLLNTSMNVKGQPLVNTREDAMNFSNMTGIKVHISGDRRKR